MYRTVNVFEVMYKVLTYYSCNLLTVGANAKSFSEL